MFDFALYEEVERAAGVPFRASNSCAEALAKVGRTEDIRVSPDGARLALVGFERNVCLFMRIAVEAGTIVLDDPLILHSRNFAVPHGMAFVGEGHFVVANREGKVSLHRLPGETVGVVEADAPAVLRLEHAGLLREIDTPGSVIARHRGGDRYELIVANNFSHRVTRHTLRLGPPPRAGRGALMIGAGLDIPDGLALSPDGKWLAVSNHSTHEVLLYRMPIRRPLPRRRPDIRLGGCGYPHGLAFSPDGRFLLVADGGAPLVHVFQAAEAGGDWRDCPSPDRSVCCLDSATYLAGRDNPKEGGPKGLEILQAHDLLLLSNEMRPFSAFRLSRVLEGL